jgi:hypothetical protein
VPDANNSHTRIVAEIIYEVLAETERTYENRGGDIPTREDYVSDVIRVPEPIMGNVAYIVDQQGATFAFPSEGDADDGYDAERRRGAVDLTRFTVVIPRQGMTWEEVADYACSHGPEDPELADALRGHRAG